MVKAIEGQLIIFVIYENPSDYPGKFVVRRHFTSANETRADLKPHAVTTNLIEARNTIPPRFTNFPKHPSDDPVIREIYL